ncbi:MAG: TlpA disulfide reductase family protein [Pedobacter sp.]
MYSITLGQDAKDIISRIIKAQTSLKTISYTLDRRDTLLTNDVRTMSGNVKLETDDRNTNTMGFKFWAKKDGESEEKVYDGYVAYTINPQTQTYTLTTSKSGILNVLNGGGGHIVFPDLVKLDTSKASDFFVREDKRNYYLTLTYPDYKVENVTNRFKVFTIDKKVMLPLAMKNHQESYGNIQDLYYKVRDLEINEPDFKYDFTSLTFLDRYKQQVSVQGSVNLPIMSLKGHEVPSFKLSTFFGETMSSADFKGKVVLLDLWEIWCSPCIAAMPKIESIYERYKDKGLLVYGISSDIRGLSAAKNMVQRKGIKIPMLIGNEQFKKDYYISSIALPMYLLIDKSGKIILLSNGFTDEIEDEIKKALASGG